MLNNGRAVVYFQHRKYGSYKSGYKTDNEFRIRKHLLANFMYRHFPMLSSMYMRYALCCERSTISCPFAMADFL